MKSIKESIIGRRGISQKVEDKYDLKKGDVVIFRNGNIGIVGEYLDYVDGPEQNIHYVDNNEYDSHMFIGRYSVYKDNMTHRDDSTMDIISVYRDITGKIIKELDAANNTVKMIKFINELNDSKRYKKFILVY